MKITILISILVIISFQYSVQMFKSDRNVAWNISRRNFELFIVHWYKQISVGIGLGFCQEFIWNIVIIEKNCKKYLLVKLKGTRAVLILSASYRVPITGIT